MRQLLFILSLCSVAVAGDCVRVDREVVVAADLAAILPTLAQADPALVIAYAPSPGVTRLLSAATLSMAAHKGNIVEPNVPAEGVCVQRRVRILGEAELRAAMMASLDNDRAQLTIVDYSRMAVPDGLLGFPLTGLNAPPRVAPDSPVLWRGRVNYDRASSVQVWAKVRITVPRTVCVAARAIAAGTSVARDQVALALVPTFPFRPDTTLSDPEQIAGRIARRRIEAGQEITVEELAIPPDIRAGDTVHVTVIIGNAQVTLEAIAASGGRKGDSIVLQNPMSHTNFRAVVDGKDRAVVHPRNGAQS